MKLKIVIMCLFVSTHCWSQTLDEYLSPKDVTRNIGIKMITEKSFDKWETISFFNREGLLVQKISYYKNELRSEYWYEYTLSDSSLVVSRIDSVNIVPNKGKQCLEYKYYYTSSGECYKFMLSASNTNYSDPTFQVGCNFVYKDGLLYSYEKRIAFKGKERPQTKIIYSYDEKKQKKQLLYCMEFQFPDTTRQTFIYNKKGQLTDDITEGSKERVYDDVFVWSNTEMNKFHIHYSTFDEHGNWTQSYFITKMGKKLRSKRKIEYW